MRIASHSLLSGSSEDVRHEETHTEAVDYSCIFVDARGSDFRHCELCGLRLWATQEGSETAMKSSVQFVMQLVAACLPTQNRIEEGLECRN